MTLRGFGPRADAARAWLSRQSAGLAGAAVLIGAITVIARAVGFGRHLVFSHTVGQTCLGSVYVTANLVPTVIFEAVAGGALVSVVVPVLSGPVSRQAREETRHITAALLTWTVTALLPLVIVVALVARPAVALLLGDVAGCPRAEAVDIGTRMLLIFLPQLVLYGVAVVLTGLLQAHRRFLAAALAPLASSLVVIGAYVVFTMVVGPRGGDFQGLGLGPQLVLAAGTTLGVVALALTVVVPSARMGLRLRPTWSFPEGVAARARGLAAAGVATLLAHQVVIVAVLRLANGQGGVGAAALYTYAWQVFHLPYAVLAIPIATSAFPALSARAARGDEVGYVTAAARTTRAVLLVCCAAAAVLAAVAGPVARVFVLGAPGGADPEALARAIAAFAPGLIGYGLVAHLGRALYASGHNRVSAGAVVLGWGAVLGTDVVLALNLPPQWVVVGFGIGNSVGMTLAGAALLAAMIGTCGKRAVAGSGRALAAGLLGGCAGYAAAAAVVAGLGPAGAWASIGLGVLGAVVALAVFAGVSALVDGPDVRAVVRKRVGR